MKKADCKFYNIDIDSLNDAVKIIKSKAESEGMIIIFGIIPHWINVKFPEMVKSYFIRQKLFFDKKINSWEFFAVRKEIYKLYNP